MEKFNSMELKVFNLIKAGKSRNDIISERVTTPANLNAILSGIYKKTDEIVKYHTERNKYEELAAYLRNNPEILSPVPPNDNNKKTAATPPQETDDSIATKVKAALNRVSYKLHNESIILSAKSQVLDEIYSEIAKEGVCLK